MHTISYELWPANAWHSDDPVDKLLALGKMFYSSRPGVYEILYIPRTYVGSALTLFDVRDEDMVEVNRILKAEDQKSRRVGPYVIAKLEYFKMTVSQYISQFGIGGIKAFRMMVKDGQAEAIREIRFDNPQLARWRFVGRWKL